VRLCADRCPSKQEQCHGDFNRNGQPRKLSAGPLDDIFRINDDGSAPSDNPFAPQPDLAKYYAYGIRTSEKFSAPFSQRSALSS
jgi:hypothetical protein